MIWAGSCSVLKFRMMDSGVLMLLLSHQVINLTDAAGRDSDASKLIAGQYPVNSACYDQIQPGEYSCPRLWAGHHWLTLV